MPSLPQNTYLGHLPGAPVCHFKVATTSKQLTSRGFGLALQAPWTVRAMEPCTPTAAPRTCRPASQPSVSAVACLLTCQRAMQPPSGITRAIHPLLASPGPFTPSWHHQGTHPLLASPGPPFTPFWHHQGHCSLPPGITRAIHSLLASIGQFTPS